jgi:hypothetical protein
MLTIFVKHILPPPALVSRSGTLTIRRSPTPWKIAQPVAKLSLTALHLMVCSALSMHEPAQALRPQLQRSLRGNRENDHVGSDGLG